jgi:hypothetical protein
VTSADETALFEQRLRALLEEHAQHVSGRVRSHLTQARHAAVAQMISGGVRGLARHGRRLWVPATGVVAAAAVLAVVMRLHQPQTLPSAAANAIASGDLDLLTDHDGLNLVEGGDGEFYEWAVYEAQAQPQPQPGQGSGGAAGHVR